MPREPRAREESESEIAGAVSPSVKESTSSPVKSSIPNSDEISVNATKSPNQPRVVKFKARRGIDWNKQLGAIYCLYNPEKLPTIAKIQEMFKGREDTLLEELCLKYKVDKSHLWLLESHPKNESKWQSLMLEPFSAKTSDKAVLTNLYQELLPFRASDGSGTFVLPSDFDGEAFASKADNRKKARLAAAAADSAARNDRNSSKLTERETKMMGRQ